MDKTIIITSWKLHKNNNTVARLLVDLKAGGAVAPGFFCLFIFLLGCCCNYVIVSNVGLMKVFYCILFCSVFLFTNRRHSHQLVSGGTVEWFYRQSRRGFNEVSPESFTLQGQADFLCTIYKLQSRGNYVLLWSILQSKHCSCSKTSIQNGR